MKRTLPITMVLLLTACGQGMIDQEEVLEGNIRSQQDPMLQKTIAAAEIGISDGDQFMTQKVNQVLQTYKVGYFYQGMATLTSSAGMAGLATPDVGGPPNCPYVGPQAVSGNDTGPQSCRFLADRSLEEAQLAKDQLDANRAIEEGFADGDGNLAHYRSWYQNGADNSLELTAALLSDNLRQAAVCDNAPSPKQSAFEKGVTLGRKLYIDAMNERLKQVGIDFDYPNGAKPSRSIRYCKANLREPSLAEAKARVQTALAQNPLCDAIGGDQIENSAYYAQYQEVLKQYEAGAFSGIAGEDSVAQSTLMGSGCCIASPLVLDLAGDGLNLGGEVAFDLLASGSKVRTSWVRGDDALLVLDANDNGLVDDGSELFGNDESNDSGFQKLAQYDSNGDQRIDAQDAVYARLQLWQDDGDGVASSDELSSLAQMGVKAIQLRYTEGARVDQHGNQLRQTAQFIRTAQFAKALGATGQVVDVWFNYR